MHPINTLAIVASSALVAISIMALPIQSVTPKVMDGDDTYSLWYYGDVIDTGMSLQDCVSMLPNSPAFACVIDGKARTGGRR